MQFFITTNIFPNSHLVLKIKSRHIAKIVWQLFFLQITSTIPLFQSKTINHSTSKFLAQPQFFVYTVTSADMHTLHPFNITALTSEGVIESQPGFSSQSYLSWNGQTNQLSGDNSVVSKISRALVSTGTTGAVAPELFEELKEKIIFQCSNEILFSAKKMHQNFQNQKVSAIMFNIV